MDWRLVGEMFCKITISKGDANLKKQVCPAFGPKNSPVSSIARMMTADLMLWPAPALA